MGLSSPSSALPPICPEILTPAFAELGLLAGLPTHRPSLGPCGFGQVFSFSSLTCLS